MNLLKLVIFVLVFALTGPLWVVGAPLAFVHWLLNKVAVFVIRWGFWEPCRWSGRKLVYAWRGWRAASQPVDEIKAKGEVFKRRARRAMRGR